MSYQPLQHGTHVWCFGNTSQPVFRESSWYVLFVSFTKLGHCDGATDGLSKHREFWRRTNVTTICVKKRRKEEISGSRWYDSERLLECIAKAEETHATHSAFRRFLPSFKLSVVDCITTKTGVFHADWFAADAITNRWTVASRDSQNLTLNCMRAWIRFTRILCVSNLHADCV
jgi:hypothetical protein